MPHLPGLDKFERSSLLKVLDAFVERLRSETVSAEERRPSIVAAMNVFVALQNYDTFDGTLPLSLPEGGRRRYPFGDWEYVLEIRRTEANAVYAGGPRFVYISVDIRSVATRDGASAG
jgi:hypothetical protein